MAVCFVAAPVRVGRSIRDCDLKRVVNSLREFSLRRHRRVTESKKKKKRCHCAGWLAKLINNCYFAPTADRIVDQRRAVRVSREQNG